MTREDADKLQKVLVDYVEIRDKEIALAKEPKPPPKNIDHEPIPDGETEREKLVRMRRRWKEWNRGQPSCVLRIGLATLIEPLIPEVRIPGGGMDLMAILGPFASVLGADVSKYDGIIPVVDGYEKVDADKIGNEEYEKLYCIRVPGDVMKEAMSLRSSRSMLEMMYNEKGVLR